MKKISLAAGILILLGFIFIITGVVLKSVRLNLLAPISISTIGYMTIANTCFLIALIVDKFDKKTKE